MIIKDCTCISVDDAMRQLVAMPTPAIDPEKWRAALIAARSKRPLRAWPWTNSALRLLAVSNAIVPPRKP